MGRSKTSGSSHRSIVNISSINGTNLAASIATYNAAKAGVISLTKTLALELAAYGVPVNAMSNAQTNETCLQRRR